MAFVPHRGPAAVWAQESIGMLANNAAVKGYTYKIDAATGYAENGAAANAYLKGVFMETKTASATSGATVIQCTPFRDGQEWLVDCTGTPVQTEVGSTVSLTDVSTIDEDDTGNTPLFDIVEIYSATDKKIVVRPNFSKLTGGAA